MAIDYEKQLKAFLESKGYKRIIVGRFDKMTAREGICIRRLPGTRDEHYGDGTYELQRIVQIIVRRRLADQAIADCEEICRLLDGAEIESANGSYQLVEQEPYTEPEEFAIETEGFHTWSFRLRAFLIIERW